MGMLTVGVVSARGVANIDSGFAGKSDPYVVVCLGNQTKQTKTVSNCLEPVWNETFQLSVREPGEEVVNFILWDAESCRQDTIIAATAVSLNCLEDNQKCRLDLPLVRAGSEGCSSGVLTVELVANGFTGLRGVVKRLTELEAQLGQEVQQLKETEGQLRAEVQQLKEVETRLNADVAALHGEVGQLQAIEGDLRADVAGLKEVEGRLSQEVAQLKDVEARLGEEVAQLKETEAKLGQEVQELKATEAKLSADVAELGSEVSRLKDVESSLRSDVARLEEVEGRLGAEVDSLGKKLQLMQGTVDDLIKTRDMLDAEVNKLDQQNAQMRAQLEDLRTIEEGMQAFAAQAGEDYAVFVKQLTSQISRNEQLIAEFAGENAKLKENRRQQQVNMLLQLSSSFAMWDNKVGLSPEEFTQYLSLLGPAYEAKVREKIAPTDDNAFGILDTDKNGTLNLAELRSMLEAILKET